MQRTKGRGSAIAWQLSTADTSSAVRAGMLSTANEDIADPLIANTPLIQSGSIIRKLTQFVILWLGIYLLNKENLKYFNLK